MYVWSQILTQGGPIQLTQLKYWEHEVATPYRQFEMHWTTRATMRGPKSHRTEWKYSNNHNPVSTLRVTKPVHSVKYLLLF